MGTRGDSFYLLLQSRRLQPPREVTASHFRPSTRVPSVGQLAPPWSWEGRLRGAGWGSFHTGCRHRDGRTICPGGALGPRLLSGVAGWT